MLVPISKRSIEVSHTLVKLQGMVKILKNPLLKHIKFLPWMELKFDIVMQTVNRMLRGVFTSKKTIIISCSHTSRLHVIFSDGVVI